MADLFGHCNIIGCPSENLVHLFLAGVILGRDNILVLIFPTPMALKLFSYFLGFYSIQGFASEKTWDYMANLTSDYDDI